MSFVARGAPILLAIRSAEVSIIVSVWLKFLMSII